jgi:hypothetical protein
VRYKRNATNPPRPSAVVTLVLLQVPGCPGADLLAGRPGFRVTRRLVINQVDAERLGKTGSPTLLADGADPFVPL